LPKRYRQDANEQKARRDGRAFVVLHLAALVRHRRRRHVVTRKTTDAARDEVHEHERIPKAIHAEREREHRGSYAKRNDVSEGIKVSTEALREPSLGPVFGVKGGGTGGGACRLQPSAEINLHFTGDLHAITAAHNLLAAMVDNHIHHGSAPRLDPGRVLWRRVMDMNDRALRQVIVGLGGTANGAPREANFDITAASEVMAVLCLSADEADLRARLGRIVVGFTAERKAVTAADLGAVGAMTALLRDALRPNLVQGNEGVPALVHGGPFANIAHGANSLIATRMALHSPTGW
jgi:formyltetrahydrofolate synthetase